MPPAQRTDPYRNFNFLVEIDSIATAAFSEVAMPDSTAAVIEYREGADAVNTVRKLPGLVKHSNIVLKRGVTDSRELFDWWKTVLDGNVQRKNMSIILLDEQRQPVKRWNVRQAWPAKYHGPDLEAEGNEVAIETIEIAHEGIELA